jgi:hypothetical protein
MEQMGINKNGISVRSVYGQVELRVKKKGEYEKKVMSSNNLRWKSCSSIANPVKWNLGTPPPTVFFINAAIVKRATPKRAKIRGSGMLDIP